MLTSFVTALTIIIQHHSPYLPLPLCFSITPKYHCLLLPTLIVHWPSYSHSLCHYYCSTTSGSICVVFMLPPPLAPLRHSCWSYYHHLLLYYHYFYYCCLTYCDSLSVCQQRFTCCNLRRHVCLCGFLWKHFMKMLLIVEEILCL